MELPDQKIIETIQSRIVSQDEFNYDRLVARPLYSMIDQSDIDQIYKIATSVRYAGNPRKRYQMIDRVMHNRGFRKLSAGTNRVAYTYFEDPNIVVKVAADKTAIMDNPREFVNQHKLKPFCTKVFEVDPSGTVGVFERVKPITSREEYMTVASDVFEMLDMITSKYVLADIGTKFFMNIGTRKGFGVVLLDFPYLYEINDPNSLVCKKPDPNSPGGFCGGLIDYDEGFNTLRCNKCGAVYRAQELGSYLKTNQIIMKGIGKMNGTKVRVSFTKNGKKYEVGNKNESDIMKEESAAIQHIPEKKPEAESSDGTLKVRVSGLKKNFSYDVDTKTPNQDVTEYNFGTRITRKPRPQQQRTNNPVPNNDRPRAPFARFSKVNDRNNLVFTIKTNTGISEILVDPDRIPDEVKKLFIPDYENINTANQELEQAKSDIMSLEDTVLDLEDKIKHHKEISDNATAKLEETEEKLQATQADRDNKVKILNNIVRENESLKAQIKDLEEKINETANQITDSAYTKIQELEDANAKLAEAEAEASDKLTAANKELETMKSDYEQSIENLKNELVEYQADNENLKESLMQYQNAAFEAESDDTEGEEEYDDEGSEDDYNNIYFLNGVYVKLGDLVNITGNKANYDAEDIDVDENTEVVVFRDNDGNFLADVNNNICAGINLTELTIEKPEE